MTNTLETAATEVGEEISGLVRTLNRTDGPPFIYEVLEVIARRYRLDDAVVRIESALGEGFFRLHRAPVDPELAGRVPAGGRVFFSEPDAVPPEVAQTTLDLCVLALRLCIARHTRHLDRRTGLLANHAFNAALEASAAQAARHGWAYTVVVLDLGEPPAHSTVDEIRLFGQALRASLRSGDVASRIAERRFAALLSNSELDAVNPFLGRVYARLGQGRDNVELSLGAAAAPTDSIDPVELRRLAASRLQPGGRNPVTGVTELTASLWEYLELELRLLPPVVHVSRNGRRDGRDVVGILIRDASPTIEDSTRRIVEAHGLDVDFEFQVLDAPGEIERPPDPTPTRSGAVAGRSRIVYQAASMESPLVTLVHLSHGDRSGVGRSDSGELRGSAEATILAAAELGVIARLSLASVSSAKGEMIGSPVRVILAETGSDRRYVGIARGETGAEAASRATLSALNGFLDGIPERRAG